ncbi:MAG TPA: aldo/keto reductase [Prolixibacteraceae bacterium]|jgi:aryl-alcohol dehydrogenase-like predicted oxidoreductase
MIKFDRREFLLKSAAGIAAASVIPAIFPEPTFGAIKTETVDTVALGNTGLNVSRIALGTGTKGWKLESDQTHLGTKKFVELSQYCFDKGIRFFDTADMYGSHPYVGAALKVIPREKVTVLTKVMTYSHEGWYETEPFAKSFDRFRKDLGTDYVDIFLMHCMINGQWPTEYKSYMDAMSEAKQKGMIKAVGISCHSLEAMIEAASNPWVDVLFARINHNGARMDSTPEKVMQVLETARKNGKGVIGMKVFGCGDLVKETEREESLNYVIRSKNVHCMTLGMESKEQVDDNVSRVMRIVKS